MSTDLIARIAAAAAVYIVIFGAAILIATCRKPPSKVMIYPAATAAA